MTYYLELLLHNYKAQLLIGPYQHGKHLVRARRSSSDDWITVEHKYLIIALYELCNRLWEQDNRLPQPAEP